MMETILPYTKLSPSAMYQLLANVPSYAKTTCRSSMDLVMKTLPLYLHGSRGVVDMIHRYIGPKDTWVQVDVRVRDMVFYRGRDTFFIYLVLSNIDPVQLRIPDTIPLQFNTSNIPVPEHATKMIPFIFDKNYTYYRTRTGHLGTCAELLPIVSEISMNGCLTTNRPCIETCYQHMGKKNYLIIINNQDNDARKYWENAKHHMSSRIVIHISDTSNIIVPNNLKYDVIIFDNVHVYRSDIIEYYSSDNDIRGRIYKSTISDDLDYQMNQDDTTMIIQIISNSKPTIEQMISCLYLFKAKRNDCNVIDIDNYNTYHVHRHLLDRVIENLIR